MKINYNNDLPAVEFGKLHLGDVFLDDEGDAMMKTKVSYSNGNDDLSSYNTVDLKTGNMYYTANFVEVIPCPDACLSIK